MSRIFLTAFQKPIVAESHRSSAKKDSLQGELGAALRSIALLFVLDGANAFCVRASLLSCLLYSNHLDVVQLQLV